MEPHLLYSFVSATHLGSCACPLVSATHLNPPVLLSAWEYLASEIAVRYYYQKGRIINQLSIDPDIITAKEILHDKNRYNSILKIK